MTLVNQSKAVKPAAEFDGSLVCYLSVTAFLRVTVHGLSAHDSGAETESERKSGAPLSPCPSQTCRPTRGLNDPHCYSLQETNPASFSEGHSEHAD
ncbi:hypothetical protein AOLI_G00193360 [Acnodon oligacanthus]